MVAARVVAEQVQADLDRIGRGEVVEEGRGRAWLRRRVDQAEQLRRRLEGEEHARLAEQFGRRAGPELLDPRSAELVRVVFVVDEQRRDAQQQLRRLRGVDLDRETPARTRDVYDSRLLDGAGWLDVFDCHRTVTGTIALFRKFCLTSTGIVR